MTNAIPNVPRELLADMLGNDHDKRIMAERHLLAMLANAPSPAGVDGLEPSGHDDLWLWFGSSRSSWLTLPRSLMHAMPDEWQKQMAGLLGQWDAAWNTAHLPSAYVSARVGAKFTHWPEWLLNYRHPAQAEIERVRATACAAAPNIAPTFEHSGS